MIGSTIAVLTPHRQTRRQISRTLSSAGIQPVFMDQVEALNQVLNERSPNLFILDCDNNSAEAVEAALAILNRNDRGTTPPVVLLSVGSDKAPLMDLIQRHDIGNLVAKHGAIRAVFPIFDERELLVTCEKVIRRNIFGIDKYVGSWGVVIHRAIITALADKAEILAKFEQFLITLDCPPSIVPAIVTVAEELILNAVVHAPHAQDGQPKYEHIGPDPKLVLEPEEYVRVSYGCDGQRLMLSVIDNFGRLNKYTVRNYLSRGFNSFPLEAETKPGGAGLGLSLSMRTIHQLIFNIQDRVRTEVIAGWYLRVNTASEFRQVGKSLNLFWLPPDSVPAEEPVSEVNPRDVDPGLSKLDARTPVQI